MREPYNDWVNCDGVSLQYWFRNMLGDEKVHYTILGKDNSNWLDYLDIDKLPSIYDNNYIVIIKKYSSYYYKYEIIDMFFIDKYEYYIGKMPMTNSTVKVLRNDNYTIINLDNSVDSDDDNYEIVNINNNKYNNCKYHIVYL